MSICIAPGFHKERDQLERFLNRAVELSRALKVSANGVPVEKELKTIVKGLQELRGYRLEKR